MKKKLELKKEIIIHLDSGKTNRIGGGNITDPPTNTDSGMEFCQGTRNCGQSLVYDCLTCCESCGREACVPAGDFTCCADKCGADGPEDTHMAVCLTFGCTLWCLI